MRVCWLEQTVAEVRCEDDWLSSDELVRLGSMRISKRRADWRLGRWTAKHAVAAYLEMPVDAAELSAIEIRAAASGAPEAFVGGRAAEVSISLSHRDGRAACAVAPAATAVGCDLEIVEPHSDGFISDYFTAPEQQRIARADEEGRVVTVALLWSAKESTLKALREGLRIDTRQVEVELPEGLNNGFSRDSWCPLRASFEKRIFHGWWRRESEVVLTLVSEPPPGVPVRLPAASQLSCHLK